MELKVVGDIVRGRTSVLPVGLFWEVCGTQCGRDAIAAYLKAFGRARWLGKAAMEEGQLLKDIAWARAHMRVIAAWLDGGGPASFLQSYGRIMAQFPTRLTM